MDASFEYTPATRAVSPSPLPSRLARPFSLDLSNSGLDVPTRLRPVSESYDDAASRVRGYTEGSSIGSISRQLGRPRPPSFADDSRVKVAPPVKGLYLAKFAVSMTACYIGIQLLITFAEVLLPFIFAVLLMIVLEPLKQFVLKALFRSSLVVFKKMHFKGCMETKKGGDRSSGGTVRIGRTDSIAATEASSVHTYGNLPEDSTAEDNFTDDASDGMRVTVPHATCQKMILAVSIMFCIGVAIRVLVLTAKIFVKAVSVLSADAKFYRRGVQRLEFWVRTYITSIHFQAMNWDPILKDLFKDLEYIGSLITENVMYTLLQAVVTMIFLLYMLWSPIKMESNTMMEQVLMSTAKYIKVKFLISACTGASVGISLWAIGLDLPAAFGFLAFLANFLPGVGSIFSSALPCIVALIDVRKTTGQAVIALLSQMAVHFFIDFVVEPVFFGISVEIHSVVVILGIWFFYKVWGGAGMLLSVPLLAVVRLLLKSVKSANITHGEDAESISFLNNVLEGRWMSSVGGEEDDVDGEFFIETSKNATPEATEAVPERSEPVGIFSALEQEVFRFYHEHRLTLDLLAILAIVVFLTIIPI